MKVVLKHAGKWLYFDKPRQILVANESREVLPCLQQAEDSGLFAAGFVSYEAASAFDAALLTQPSGGFPLLCFGLFDAPETRDELDKPKDAAYEVGQLEPCTTREAFSSAIGEIKRQIAAGATYQVNYTYRLTAGFKGNAWAFFCDLVEDQRTENAAFVEYDGFTICSASPELFFNVAGGSILSRPMKGTARRGRTMAEDWQQAEALHASEKDRAENIMIVDMVRNDIGRIAKMGSVETASRFDVEKYPTVWQMTSTVCGHLEKCTLPDLFKALFPCASITGAPKAKTMEIIRQLETSPRKIYTGSIGFFTPQKEASFNVAIRTALISGNKLEFGVGGGIVWDSNADAEYEETLTKARVLTQPRPQFELLETMLWEPGSGIFLLSGHLQRLGRSAAYFDIPFDAHEILGALESATDKLEPKPHRMRLLLSRKGNLEIQATETTMETGEKPARVAIARQDVDSRDVFLFHKTTHRTVYERAKADFPEHDDVILFNERGEVTEGTIANLVVRFGERLITPAISCGLLAGTFREHLLKSGEIEEGFVTLDALKTADDVFMINSVRRWRKANVDWKESAE